MLEVLYSDIYNILNNYVYKEEGANEKCIIISYNMIIHIFTYVIYN